MSVYDLKFKFTGDKDDYEFSLISYLCMLSGNNQIIFETLNISGTEDIRTARLTTPFEDSLYVKYNNVYVNEALKNLQQFLKEPIEISYVGDDYTYINEFSTGKEDEHYILSIHPNLRDFSPVCCGQCNRNIPYYLLPMISEETYSVLSSWEVNYAAYDKLFYSNGIGEFSAHKMMCNISSKLNQKGLDVCRKLENELKKPVYYYLYRFYGKQPKNCPICKSDWKQQEGSFYDYQCDHCKIVAHKTSNEIS